MAKKRASKRSGSRPRRTEASTSSRGPRVSKSVRDSKADAAVPSCPPHPDRLEGRNVVLCAMRASNRVRAIWRDRGAKPCPKLEEIGELAAARGIGIEEVPRQVLDAVADNRVHNGLIGFAEPLPSLSLTQVLDRCDREGREPFVLLLNQVQYEQNLGAILRTAACAGADALVLPTRRGARLSPTVQRIAMGGAEEVPVVFEGMMSALSLLRKRGVRVVGAEAGGENLYTTGDFGGALALVLGGEDRGLSSAIAQRCDQVLALPMAAESQVGSLNVSVAAGILIYERMRRLALDH